MKTLKNNFDSIRENKENYLSPSCKVYDLEMEGMVCTSPTTDVGTEGTGNNPEGGEVAGFPQSKNLGWN